MEKTKKKLITASYVVLGFVALTLIDLIVTLIRGVDTNALYPTLSDELAPYALAVTVGSLCLSAGLHVWIALWGVQVAKTNSTGWGHLVLEFILSLLAMFNLYAAGEAVVQNANPETIYGIIYAVLWLGVLLVFDWYALHFRQECLDAAKQSK